MTDIDRRQFTLYTLGALVLPSVTGCGLSEHRNAGESPESIENPLSEAKLITKPFEYSAEVTHNDIHDLEWESEKTFKHVKAHFDDKGLIGCFQDAYQASYDFHTHMHSPFEEDWARTREALDILAPSYERLYEASRETELASYADEVDSWYQSLRYGIVPEREG